MQPRRTGRHRRLLVLLVAFAAASALVLSAAPPASAHTDLVSSNPTEGMTLRGAPQTISLVFNEEMNPRLGAVSLSIDDRFISPLTLEAGPTTASLVAVLENQARPATTSSGDSSWVISYRVTSTDGHPVSGVISFFVAPAAAVPAQPATPPTTDQPSTGAPEATLDSHAGEQPRPRSDGSMGPWRLAAPIAGGVLLLLLLSVLAVTRLARVPQREQGDPSAAGSTTEPPSDEVPSGSTSATGSRRDEPIP